MCACAYHPLCAAKKGDVGGGTESSSPTATGKGSDEDARWLSSGSTFAVINFGLFLADDGQLLLRELLYLRQAQEQGL